ncbi:SDR family NAD(P)-dependent oxidoreductase [Streptomyces sp. NPDC049040]|uniref:SDR family NAD(P)-dependent oxidoreductase n=1 Tax=Streptomyces sp. NPDC049040 TaxID=3365593 RepID=UPI0037206AA9
MARSGNELEQTIEPVRGRGGRAVAAPADPGSPGAVAEVVSRAEADLGPIDVLVNNAATVQPLAPSTLVGAAAWSAAVPAQRDRARDPRLRTAAGHALARLGTDRRCLQRHRGQPRDS